MKVQDHPPAYTLIDQPDQLPAFLAALDRVDEVSLDTEADNMFHYRTRVCLLQFLVEGKVTLIDVLAPLPLASLWQKLATKHLVMHGSDFDIRLLWDLCQFRPKSLFDTMLAAQLLNHQRIGLAGLLEQHFGVILDKEGQKANWSKRPLTKKLLDYAALDVWHLPALRDILTRELVRLDRIEWLDQQCRRQIESGLTGFPKEDENDWRIGWSERFRGRGLGVLHAIWHWRQDWAQKLDVPPFKVCGQDLLIAIAGAAEDGDSEEAIFAKINLGKRHDRLAPTLGNAVRQGLARDPQTLPRRRRSDLAPLTVEEVALQDRIKADRDRIATQLQIEPTLIASRAQLAQIARAPARIADVLLPWQADILRRESAAFLS